MDEGAGVEPRGPLERATELGRLLLFVLAVGVVPMWFLLTAALVTLDTHPSDGPLAVQILLDDGTELTIEPDGGLRFWIAGGAAAAWIGLLGLGLTPLVGGWMVWQRWRGPREEHAADLLGRELVAGQSFKVTVRREGDALGDALPLDPGPDAAEATWQGEAVTESVSPPPPPPSLAPATFVDDDDDDVDDLFR